LGYLLGSQKQPEYFQVQSVRIYLGFPSYGRTYDDPSDVAVYGYLRGRKLKGRARVHIAGVGDATVS